MQKSREERLLEAVDAVKGVARTEMLREHRVSRYDIRVAVDEGLIVRVRPGWVARPDADPMLVAAARRGVVLTCVTQARRLGIWVHDEKPTTHVAATPGTRGDRSGKARVHWALPTVPRHPDELEDSIENVLVIVAVCEPFERAVATWESALNKQLETREALARLPLGPDARRVLAEAWPFADAGLETYLRLRLRWLRLPLHFQTWIAGHRVDALIGARLVVQIDGATHVGPQGTEDIRHYAELTLMGYHVIRVSYTQIMSHWEAVQTQIMLAVAQGLHHAR